MFGSKQQEIPKMQSHAGYAAATAKLAELQQKMQAAERRVVEINAQLSKRQSGTAAQDGILQKAMRLLSSSNVGPSEPANAAGLRVELEKLCEERRVLSRAVELQKQVVQAECAAASRTVCQAAAVPHRETVKQILQSLIAIAGPNQAEHELRETLYLDGARYIEVYLRPMYVKVLGDPLDWNSYTALWVREAFEYGFIEEGDVPAEWRRAWWERNGFKLSFLRKREEAKAASPQVSAAQRDGWLTA